MTSHQSSSSQGSSRNRVNLKDLDLPTKKTHGNNFNTNFSINSQPFELPTVFTNGMKNIEHFIDKTLVDGKQWYRCKWQNCSYSTIRSDSIVRHMRKHTGERPYVCTLCNYATIQSSALKIHMRKHTGERPYVCNYLNCGKKFSVLNTLQIHLRTHSGIRPYSCNSCNYSSNDRCKLVSHMRKTHQTEVLDPNKSFPRNIPSGPSSSFSMSNGNSLSSNNSHLALVNDAMSSQLLSSSLMNNYNPFAIQNSGHLAVSNALTSSNPKSAPSSTSLFPLNFLSNLSVFSGSENIQNYKLTDMPSHIYSSNTLSITISDHSKTSDSSTQTSQENKSSVATSSKKRHNPQNECSPMLEERVSREENSIKRVMAFVDKKMIFNRTSYVCKWPDCRYESLRSDSLVRHIRSHTGERPYRCSVPDCQYSTIQRSTLNKHYTRHLNNLFTL